MTVYIMRHGESLATLDPTLFGRTDPATIPLSEWGYEQAVGSGKALAQHFQDTAEKSGRSLRVYYSPHTRIVQSKDACLKGLGDAVTIVSQQAEHLLREREHGEFDGLDLDQQKAKDPILFDLLHHGDSFTRYTTKMPKGESLEDIDLRMKEFVARLGTEVKPDEDVLVVTHGGNCSALEDMLVNHYDAQWIEPAFDVPGTGDIRKVETNFQEPGQAETLHQGKKRSLHLPKDYKTAEYGAAQPAAPAR